MRRWRRRAYHAERRTARVEVAPIESQEALRETLARHQAKIGATHRALALRLRSAGDEASAVVLEQSIPLAKPSPGSAVSAQDEAYRPNTAAASADDDPRHLLIDAQKPLEALADVLETVMASAEGDLFAQAADAMDDVVKRIAQISLRIASLREG